MAAGPYAFNRPDHEWRRDYVGDFFACLTDLLTIALIVGLALRLGLLAL